MREFEEAKSRPGELRKLIANRDERDRLAGRLTGDELMAALKTSGSRLDQIKAQFQADQLELHALRKEVMLLRQQAQSKNTNKKTSHTTVRVIPQ